MKKTDLYNLQQASPRGQPGLERFKREEDGLFYFHYNDQNGKPVLFSQGYENASKRDKGLESVMENGAEEAQYKNLEETGGHFFVIRAKNNREIARSRNFATSKEAETMATALRRNLREEKTGDQKATVAPGRSQPPAKPKSDQPSRYSFHVTFYPAAEGKPLRGRIDYPLEKDKALFAGLDLTAIQAFIQKYLPKEPVPSVEGIKLPQPIRLLQDGQVVNKKVFPKGAPLSVQLQVAPEELAEHPSDQYSATVYAKNLQRQSRVLIGEREGNVPKDGRVEIPVLTDLLEPDLYRLLLVVNLASADEAAFRLEGSELVQVH